ncbi:putative phosphotransferase [Peptoclostridium acidaminophilum DSM 3953]|uniref:Putative pyruvate, phosphate dikinase regulatory protein n=1 Tax=Peptoclostridium acidaminophilum DSM 3953 TaxID=1286171 RepID=W8U750_PEPAC|nr:pyruvate, water dikinase regulatory protein [Peptoclostridium acidaminophilum]AHM56716.1 putative phosphotransferase [Peptoclostridium acidaminophilum DSM 3953]
MNHLVIYVISDSLGETAEQVARASISQFTTTDYEIKRYSYVLDEENLGDILNLAKEENSVILYTLVNLKFVEQLVNFCSRENIPNVDLLSDLINSIALRTNLVPKREPGIIRKLDEKYFRRVEAIEFAVKYDDGKDPRGFEKADIVLIGISRTSKTPLSMYLANKNIKVANIPLVPEAEPPRELYDISPRKIVGLTNSPQKLNQIRTERLKALGLASNANYASYQRILEEISYAETIMRRIGCPIINVANKAIEETAGIILDIMKANGIKIYKD